MEERYPGVEFSQFTGAEMIARKYGFSRDELDAYSYDSHRKATPRRRPGTSTAEIVPLDVALPDGSTARTRSTRASASTRRSTASAR